MEGEYAYKNLYSTALKHSWAGEIKNVSTLVAIGVDKVGHRSMLGIRWSLSLLKRQYKEP